MVFIMYLHLFWNFWMTSKKLLKLKNKTRNKNNFFGDLWMFHIMSLEFIFLFVGWMVVVVCYTAMCYVLCNTVNCHFIYIFVLLVGFFLLSHDSEMLVKSNENIKILNQSHSFISQKLFFCWFFCFVLVTELFHNVI